MNGSAVIVWRASTLTSFQKQIENHDKFQEEGSNYLRSLGLEVHDFHTYHKNNCGALQNMAGDVTSLYIKGWSDSIVISPGGYSVLVDWKSEEYKRTPDKNNIYPNWALEATALSFHYHLSKLGMDILYAYKNPFYPRLEKGLTIADPPSGPQFIDMFNKVIFFPGQSEGRVSAEKQRILLKASFGESIKFVQLHTGCRSADPFVLIRGNTLASMEDWKYGFQGIS